ncbi:MAG: ABC transporter permease subunit [Phycisphaerales bacterium]
MPNHHGDDAGQPAPTAPIRRRKTSARVLWSDRIAKSVITVGGIGTIVAVLTVAVYLVWVSVPLFGSSSAEKVASFERPAASAAAKPVQVSLDEYANLVWTLYQDGKLVVARLDNGAVVQQRALFPDSDAPTAFGYTAQAGFAAAGFADGTLRFGAMGFESHFENVEDVPEGLRETEIGAVADVDGRLYQRVNKAQFRVQSFQADFGDPVTLAEGVAVSDVDISVRPQGPIIAALADDGTLHIKNILERRNILTGKTTVTLTGGQAPIELVAQRGAPKRLLLTGVADNVYIVWDDGTLARYDTRNIRAPEMVEIIDIVPEEGAALTSLAFVIGKTSLAVGDSSGNVGIWFRIKPEGFDEGDGSTLVPAHSFPGEGSAAISLSPSLRSRNLAAGFEDGSVALYQVTAENTIARVEGAEGQPVLAVAIAPKDDEIFGVTASSFVEWKIDAAHPEINLASIFGKVWYEGAAEPEHVWQSSSGTDDFEPKYGLMPLIFGTVKATVYSLMFGAPLALLAAIYTSEFLAPRVRMRLKPIVEMMASLPSVVLGFLAGLVFAPFVEDIVPETLALFFTLPVTLLAGAHLVQLVPERFARIADRWRLALMILCLPIAIGAAFVVGPAFEALFFSGDIKAWLAGQVGDGAGGWMLLLIPICGVVCAVGAMRIGRPILRTKGANWGRQRLALASTGLFIAGVLATVLLAAGLSKGLAVADLDPRGTFVDTYVQRNALIVGFVMGFAIIPIIYTLAEDALSSVPEHLRSASLGAGATPWQTAVRVVIPVAMSGLFSALMIGFGRAVGETMIVLMAAGNTPVMEWNIFNGFRTLSANIAVELPEAVRGSSHYRMLFLAALALFVMTFLVNTFAELVRQRFRKRAFQL